MNTPHLPVLAISLEAYRLLFRNFGAYLRLSWLPFLILFVATVGTQFYNRDVTGSFGDGDIVLEIASSVVLDVLGMLFETCAWLVTIPVATAWTRMVLDSPEQRAQLAVGRAEGVYLLRYVCLALIMLVVLALGVGLLGSMADLMEFDFDIFESEISAQPIVALFLFGFVFSLALSVFVITRFLFSLPAAAVGNASRLRNSFVLTKGRMWALFAILLLTLAPELIGGTALIVWGGDLELGASDGYLQAARIALQTYAVGWLFFPVSVAALALAYRHLGGMTEPAADPAPAT
ncbi:MAG: hypothetical protein OEU46_17510 [Alphaproteobacteria bacterium]|nr:hypothetical protein [Alphaproteobacteria bacterium]